MKESTSKNHYNFANRFVLFLCGMSAAIILWILGIVSSIGGGAWPAIYISDSSFYFFLRLYGYLELAVLIIPFTVFFHIRTYTALLIAVSIFIPLASLFAQRLLFVALPIYIVLAFFTYRFDRRRSASQNSKL